MFPEGDTEEYYYQQIVISVPVFSKTYHDLKRSGPWKELYVSYVNDSTIAFPLLPI
jgi:hypothetical protein